MIKFYNSLFLSSVIFLLFIQISFTQDCNIPSAKIDLDVNSVKARLNTDGRLWFDEGDGVYFVPKSGQSSSLFAGSLWMGGLSPSSNLHIAGQTYDDNSDYRSGPLNHEGLTDESNCDQWDRFFEINREDIKAHQTDWSEDHQIDGPIPNSILGWPSVGNPYFFDENGFDLPNNSEGLAPFFDRDEDGIYDPAKGDFPLAKGDQSIWWVYNDNGSPHFETQGSPVQMEVQVNAFSFETGPAAAETTTFYDFRLIYHGKEPLSDFWLSLWIDPDLGCWQDDFIGCNPEESLAFAYNGDAFDENCGGTIGYGFEVPILGIKVLKSYAPGNSSAENFDKFIYYDNASQTNNSAITDPRVGPEYYNYMKGLWRDGTSLSQGGNGYNPGADPYDFAYDGNPSDPVGWSECSVPSEPGDRRFLISFGPFNLQPGAIGELSFAVIWIGSQSYPCPDISPLIDAANEMKELYDSHGEDIISTSTNELFVEERVDINPNPANSEISFRLEGLDSELKSIQVFSVDGKFVKQLDHLSGKKVNLSLEDLEAGLFIYRLQLKDGTMAVGRFVKQ